jgi:hypothetical protein
MKIVIEDTVYSTETATSVGFSQYSYPGNLDYEYEELYRNESGEYFLYSEWSDDESIHLMDVNDAKVWAETHLDADEYIAEFGEPEE